jgi:hypothetical protein
MSPTHVRQVSRAYTRDSKRNAAALLVLVASGLLVSVAVWALQSGQHANLPTMTASGLKRAVFSPIVSCSQESPDSLPPIEALVFYGRRANVQILDCYLKANLRTRGGVLQRVHFLVRTAVKEDLDFLETLLESEPAYRKHVIPSNDTWDWSFHYKGLKDSTWYFKIDDDTLYIADGALEAMWKAAQQHHETCLVFSANVINHSVLTYKHLMSTAIRPYTRLAGTKGWVSTQGQVSEVYPIFKKASFDGWNDCALKSWECAAMNHYSFIEALLKQRLLPYHFYLHDFNAVDYWRWSINFILFRGGDFNKGNVGRDDEQDISVTIPHARKRHSCAVGRAVAVHYAYGPQREGLDNNTDVRDRYRAVAQSMCGALLPIP